MEVMGGATFMDGDWESICGILSFDQASDISNSISDNIDHQGLLGLLMGNSNPSTSQCDLGFPFNHTNQVYFPNPFSYNHFQLSPSSDLSIGLNHGGLVNANESCYQFVQPCMNDEDQVSSLTSSSPLTFLMNPMNNDVVDEDHLMKRKHDQLEVEDEIRKRSRSTDNRKMKARSKKDEEEEKSSSDTSDNESNEEAKETPKLNGKKKANRGAATDPQSLYARKRRERITERLRILQNLVPNGTKVDISTMLEEAVSYVKFLQMQIKLLSSDDMWMYAPLAYNGFNVGL